MTEDEIYKKCVAKLDEIAKGGFDFDDWSIEDAFTEGAIFGTTLAEPKLVNGYTYEQLLETIENAKKTVTKEITKLQQENNKLLDVINNQDVKIADLEKQIEKKEYQEENCLNKIDHKEEVIRTLQEMIEKMKCCGNCEFDGTCLHCACGKDFAGWKLKEIEK